MPQLWRSAPPEETSWTGWDDVHIVYHRASGKTHVLNDATAALLHDVLQTPKTREAAALELSERQGLKHDGVLADYVGQVIAHLEQLGLVVRS